jgi:hypothetical protein
LRREFFWTPLDRLDQSMFCAPETPSHSLRGALQKKTLVRSDLTFTRSLNGNVAIAAFGRKWSKSPIDFAGICYFDLADV